MTFLPGAISDVKPGQTIVLNGMTDGQNLTPNAFAVGVDGTTPPIYGKTSRPSCRRACSAIPS